MTLPLTRPPCGDASHDACSPVSAAPPGWRERSRRWRQRAASPRGATVLLALSALFAGAVALFSTNPPERLWGILAAGPYALAALAALAAGPGPGSPWRSPWPGP